MIGRAPRRDTIGVAVLAVGSGLVTVGLAAFWLLLPLAGAALTIVLGVFVAAFGVRALQRPPL